MKTCAMLVVDRRATARLGRLFVRPCGARALHVVTMNGDTMFAVCSRHDSRLRRAGVEIGDRT